MSVKKVTKKAEVEVTTPEVEVTESTEVETETTTEVEEVVNTENEVEETVEENTTGPEIEIDTEVADVSNAPKEKNVRVKIKKDIKCLTSVPGKRWNTLVDKAITLLAGGFIAWLLSGVNL